MNHKLFTAVFIALLLTACTQTQPQTPNTTTPPPSATLAASKTPDTNPTDPPPSTEPVGIISGKLCYPSQFLPKGEIVAKRTSDDKIFSLDYAGSNNGGKTTYELYLPPGTYNLRYQAHASEDNTLNGYHTACTGSEPICQDQKTPRQMISVTVKDGQTTPNISLCDFYYSPAQEPKF